MKKGIFAIVLIIATVLLVSCSSEPEVNVGQMIKEAEAGDKWVLVSVDPVTATSNSVGSKVGEASTYYYDSKVVSKEVLVEAGVISEETSYLCGVYEACKNGGITKISTVDKKTYEYESVTMVVVVVTGE